MASTFAVSNTTIVLGKISQLAIKCTNKNTQIYYNS